MERQQTEYKDFLSEIWKWAKKNVALSTMIGITGVILPIYTIHYNNQIKPKRDFWVVVESNLSHMRMRAELISELCGNIRNGINKEKSAEALEKLFDQQLIYIFNLGTLTFDSSGISKSSLDGVVNFISWNHSNYKRFMSENKCLDNLKSPDEIDKEVKELTRRISKDLGQH